MYTFVLISYNTLNKQQLYYVKYHLAFTIGHYYIIYVLQYYPYYIDVFCNIVVLIIFKNVVGITMKLLFMNDCQYFIYTIVILLFVTLIH